MRCKGSTPDRIAVAVKDLVSAEMRLFDSLHPVVRSVITEHDAPILLTRLFREAPEAYRLAKESPHMFAQKLRDFMDQNQKRNEARLKAEIEMMIKEITHG